MTLTPAEIALFASNLQKVEDLGNKLHNALEPLALHARLVNWLQMVLGAFFDNIQNEIQWLGFWFSSPTMQNKAALLTQVRDLLLTVAEREVEYINSLTAVQKAALAPIDEAMGRLRKGMGLPGRRLERLLIPLGSRLEENLNLPNPQEKDEQTIAASNCKLITKLKTVLQIKQTAVEQSPLPSLMPLLRAAVESVASEASSLGSSSSTFKSILGTGGIEQKKIILKALGAGLNGALQAVFRAWTAQASDVRALETAISEIDPILTQLEVIGGC